MSRSVFKKEYICDCGCDYGSCEAKCAVILLSNNSCDIYTLYHTCGHGEIKTSVGGLDYFTDNYLSALKEVINMRDGNGESLTEAERDFIFK